jgi:hypothetical protein
MRKRKFQALSCKKEATRSLHHRRLLLQIELCRKKPIKRLKIWLQLLLMSHLCEGFRVIRDLITLSVFQLYALAAIV